MAPSAIPAGKKPARKATPGQSRWIKPLDRNGVYNSVPARALSQGHDKGNLVIEQLQREANDG